MELKKWILPLLLPFSFSCELVETQNPENDFIEVWLYSSRMQCTEALESGAPCHYYSLEKDLMETQWKSLNYEVDNFGFQPGYYYRALIEKYWLELDPIQILDDDLYF